MTYETVINALSDSTRRQILEHLRGNPATVTELAESQPVSRPAVSQHLRVLHDSKLVKVTPSGNRRIYSVNPSGLNELKSYLDTFWSDVLDAYTEEIKLMEKRNARSGD